MTASLVTLTTTVQATSTTAECEQCPAASGVLVTLPSGLSLAFCHHHTKTHDLALVLAGATFQLIAH